MTYTTEQIERHLAIRAANVGEDGADVQIVRQLLAERDAAREALHRINDLTQHNMGMSARDERCINREALSALGIQGG